MQSVYQTKFKKAQEDFIFLCRRFGTSEVMDGPNTKGLMCKTDNNKLALPQERVMGHKPSPDSDTRANNKRHKCEYCEKSFQYSRDVIMHLRTHTGEKPFNCKDCPQNVSQKSNLVTHTRTHTGEKPYKCKICPSKFSRKDVLTCHNWTHTGEKPYKCEYCHKAFAFATNWIQHTKTHTGEKPFECRFCDYSAIRSSTVFNHERTHKEEKPYKCQLCCFSSKYKQGLRYHEIRHTDGGRKGGGRVYQCPTCPKVYPYPSNLSRHKKSHKRGKQLKDTLNDYSASSKSAAVSHKERRPNATGNYPSQTENSPIITKRPLRSFSQKIRTLQEQAGLAADQERSSIECLPNMCRACGFTTTTDADGALHMSALHKLPVVSLRRLSFILT